MNMPRVLTHDEKRASEAAFQGRPFNPEWSKAALAVYEGIRSALGEESLVPHSQTSDIPSVGSHDPYQPKENQVSFSTCDSEIDATSVKADDVNTPTQLTSREEAIKAGLLIDVTAVAHNVGLNIPVGITKPLWEESINPSSRFSEEVCNFRVRDLLMAVRLRLASVDTQSPWIEVPALLSFPPDPIPQLFPIYALFHKDMVSLDCLTLIHPQELSSLHPPLPQT